MTRQTDAENGHDSTEAIPQPDFEGAGSFGGEVLKIANQEFLRGVKEIPDGSNRGPDVDRYVLGHRGVYDYLLGSAWCGRFAAWCVEGAAIALNVVSPITGWGDLASAGKWTTASVAHGKMVDEPKPGRVGIISAGSRGHGHLVLIATIEDGGQRVTTIEGNSRNCVARRWRDVTEFIGFVDFGVA